MCRYSNRIFKPHYVCFNCKKQFKQHSGYDLLKKIGKYNEYVKIFNQFYRNPNSASDEIKEKLLYYKKTFFERSIKCPECRKLMADLGFDFRAPKKNKIKEWKIIESIYKIGRKWYTCGCNGPGYIPKKLIDYKEYLNKMLLFYKKQINEVNKNDDESIIKRNYWFEKISSIKNEINELS